MAPLVIHSAAEPNTVDIPKVIIKELPIVPPVADTKIPLKTPSTSPDSNARSIAPGTQACGIRTTEITPQIDIIDPTERSTPPDMITKVIPIAKSPVAEICLKILMIFWPGFLDGPEYH